MPASGHSAASCCVAFAVSARIAGCSSCGGSGGSSARPRCRRPACRASGCPSGSRRSAAASRRDHPQKPSAATSAWYPIRSSSLSATLIDAWLFLPAARSGIGNCREPRRIKSGTCRLRSGRPRRAVEQNAERRMRGCDSRTAAAPPPRGPGRPLRAVPPRRAHEAHRHAALTGDAQQLDRRVGQSSPASRPSRDDQRVEALAGPEDDRPPRRSRRPRSRRAQSRCLQDEPVWRRRIMSAISTRRPAAVSPPRPPPAARPPAQIVKWNVEPRPSSLDADVATHHLDEALRDRQPRPVPPERRVTDADLRERAEQPVHALLRFRRRVSRTAKWICGRRRPAASVRQHDLAGRL